MAHPLSRPLLRSLLVALVCSCSFSTAAAFSEPAFKSIIDNIDDNGDIIPDIPDSFDFGKEFMVDEILMELQDMGLRPRLLDKAQPKCGEGSCGVPADAAVGHDYDTTGRRGEGELVGPSSSSSSSSGPVSSTSDDVSDYTPTEGSVLVQATPRPDPFGSLQEAPVVPQSSDGQAGEEDSSTANLKAASDLLKSINEELDKLAAKTEGGKSSQPATGGLDYDDGPSSLERRSIDESVSDLLGPVKGERQARLFYNFDRGSAFNTSVAFTIPLFSFTLPGAGDVTDDGLDGNVFGTMAFVSLFLLGGLGVAIYTTTQGSVGDTTGTARYLRPEFPGAQLLMGESDASLASAVYAGLAGLATALDLESCGQLAVCEAHQQPRHYGLLTYPLRLWANSRPDQEGDHSSPRLEAAQLGTGGGDCSRSYPCIVDPLETAWLAYDVIAGKYSS